MAETQPDPQKGPEVVDGNEGSNENENVVDKVQSKQIAVKPDEGLLSTTDSRITRLPPGEKRSCCYRFWNAIFKFFANDAIYGSFVGPHPVSFLCCCLFCKNACKGSCRRPFVLASVATKAMWFLMLIFIMILSCFFIIPYPKETSIEAISNFFPCRDSTFEDNDTRHYRKVDNNITGNCHAHGGYFMVYRNFFAFSLLLLISSLIMINVKSTGRNRKRAKMHHGFWMYKYIILFVLLLISYLAILVEAGGIFEYLMSWVGLLSALIFSFAEITFLLDILEPCVIKNRTSKSDWADCLYWTFCGIMIIVDLLIIIALCIFFATRQYGIKPADYESDYSTSHIVIICYAIAISITLIVVAVINERKKKFPYSGFLQTTFVIFYILMIIWSALGNSPDIWSRPHYNVYNNTVALQNGNIDTYFKSEGCVQGITSLVALMYYVFWNGPRSTTAPLSILFDKVLYMRAKKPEIPVIPTKLSENSAEQFSEAISESRVWDDEQNGVRYSWSLFFVVMILGSFAIMMGMCNYADPWAVQMFASSYPALSIKLLISAVVCTTYILVTTMPCRKIFPLIDVETPVENAVEDVGEKVEAETEEDENSPKKVEAEMADGTAKDLVPAEPV